MQTIHDVLARFPDLYTVACTAKKCARFADSNFPISITATEYEFIREIVGRYGFCEGFEIATGTGISAIAAASAMPPGGRLATLDSYIEARENSCDNYFDKKDVVQDPPAYQAFCNVVTELSLPIEPWVGRSPEDVPLIAGNDRFFDYVFIDAEHTDAAVRRDVNAVLPFLAREFVVLIHDWHCFHKPTHDWLESQLGPSYTPENCLHPGSGFNLRVFDRMK
jgi:hypothetical protein